MISLIERRDGLAKIKAESTDVLQVNYTDINKRVDYIFDEAGDSIVWDTNNPADDTPIQPPTSTIEFATDEEVEQAIQAIIDSYEEVENSKIEGKKK